MSRGAAFPQELVAATRLIPLTDVIVARRTLSELLVQEAESYGDAFSLSLHLVGESATGAAAVDDVSSGKDGTQ